MLTIDNKIFLELVDYLKYAPTGDNSQHWYFKHNNTAIDILVDLERADHNLNQDECTTKISLGCLIEIAYVWADINGYLLSHQIYDDKDLPRIASLYISSNKTSPKSQFDKKTITQRNTNRKAYSKLQNFREIELDLKKLVSDLNVQVHSKKDISKKMKAHLFRSEKYIWHNRKAFMDTTKWIRYTYKEAKIKRDGFFLPNINLNYIDGILVKLLRSSETVFKILSSSLIRIKIFFDINKYLNNLGHLVCVSTQQNRTEDLVEIGRATYRIWLYFTKKKINAQPQTLASLGPTYCKASGKLPKDCPPEYNEFFRTSIKTLHEEFGISTDRYPFWMLRFGTARDLRKKELSMRRKPEDLIIK